MEAVARPSLCGVFAASIAVVSPSLCRLDRQVWGGRSGVGMAWASDDAASVCHIAYDARFNN